MVHITQLIFSIIIRDDIFQNLRMRRAFKFYDSLFQQPRIINRHSASVEMLEKEIFKYKYYVNFKKNRNFIFTRINQKLKAQNIIQL